VRHDEELEMNQFENRAGKAGNLGLKGKPLIAQEEDSTKGDDATIPYHLWNSQLKRLWDLDILPPPYSKTSGGDKRKVWLRFWEMKLRRSFFAWFSKEFQFTQADQSVVSWDGTKYIWGGKQKDQYRHYWRNMWGHRDNERRKYLVAVDD
jgi:hypothetical protein